MSSTENTPVINPNGDISSVNAAQYLTLRTANPIIAADGTLPFACPGRDDLTDFLYETESGSILLALDPEGSMTSLCLWEADGQYATQTDRATVESGAWTEIDGGDMWEQLSIVLRGTNVAQQETIDKMSKLRGGEPAMVTREGDPGKSRVTARWTAQVGPTGEEEFVVVMDEGGQTLTVDWGPVAVAR